MALASAKKPTIQCSICPILRSMKYKYVLRCLPVAALLYCLPGHTTTVYKSVDESGVVSYSDSVPENNTLLEEVEFSEQDPPPNSDAQQRLEDMRETTDRMAADRMAREKHRAEMRELQAKTDALREPQYTDYPDYPDYTTIYTGYPRYYPRRHRPGHVKPVHPIARPPLRRAHSQRSIHDNFPAPHIKPLFTPRTRGAPH